MTTVAATLARPRKKLRAALTPTLVTTPLVVWVGVMLVVPFGLMALYSVWQVRTARIVPAWTWKNYTAFLANPIYRGLLIKTVETSAVIGGLSALLGFLVALFVRACPPRWRKLLFMAILTPLWVDYLTRIYAWQIILGDHGLINLALLHLGLISQPLTFFFYNLNAVVLVLVSVTLPFAFIPIYAAIENIPDALHNAARDLGATDRHVLTTVILPLAMPGLITGFALAFIYAVGDYLTPSLVGGTSGLMLGNIIQSQFYVYNWPLGAAMAAILFGVILVVLGIVGRAGTVEAVLEG